PPPAQTVPALMQIVRDWRDLSDALKGAAVAVGAFDGVHRGHQAVIAGARDAAERLGAPLGVVSFDPHPRRWFQKDAAPFRLMTAEQMAEALAPLGECSFEADQRWSALLENNVGSMQRLTRALLPRLRAGASVINQASIWGLKGVPGFSAYVASKHAVVGLTRSLAWELGPRRIRVNAVCPGWIGTDAAMRSLQVMADANGRSDSAELAAILANQAIPELLTPADLGGTFLFLGSPLAAALTGQALSVSHGEVMH
ncbi:SDR family oxidoreductase, partial [Methylobacterium organophilum]|nr:SDR family oxidoreductase [Methylobacterium organophilum]